MTEEESSPEDTMGERVSGNTYWLWVLMKVDRWKLTVVLLASTFLALVLSSQLGLSPIRDVASEQSTIQSLFSSMILAIITGTTIVVTITQLVLSQELGAAGEQHERMQESLSFRKDVEEFVGFVSQPNPALFLSDHLGAIEDQALSLRETAKEQQGEELHAEVEDFVNDLVNNAWSVKELIAQTDFSEFDFIWYSLNFNYSWKIYRARQIRQREELTNDTAVALDRLIEGLTLYGPAREHFKTLYFQWALINLSRAVLYISIPALVFAGMMLFYVDSSTLPGATLGIDNLVWLLSAGLTIGLAPFFVFIVYILRVATVAKRTLAMGPFILRTTDQNDDQ